jgi:hypothetical protein
MGRFAVGVAAAALFALIAIHQNPAPALARGPLTLPFPTTNYYVTQEYWTLPLAYHEGHPAYDLVPVGTSAIIASAPGVASVHWDANCGPDTSQAQPSCDDNLCGAGESYGRWVDVDHGGGMHVLYTHLSSFTVTNGQSVARGEQLGVIGSAGCSTGLHIHFQVRINGANANPGNPKTCDIATTLWASCPAGLSAPDGRGPNLNGDDRDDVITFNLSGQGLVSLSNGNTFGPPVAWGSVSTWGDIPATGDFDGDGKDDVVSFTETGQAIVALSTDAGFDTPSNWGGTSPWGDIPATGDFNGDGRDDIVTFTPMGEALVALSYGAGFGSIADWGDTFDWGEIPQVGDFNGDGRDDVIAFKQSGQAAVSLSTGAGFTTPAAWGTVFAWNEIPATGDFNGDARDDAISFNGLGQGVISLSTGSGFTGPTPWGNVFAWGEIPATGDFNGDGRDDASAFSPGGYAVVSLSNGGGFAPASGWSGAMPWGHIPGGFQSFGWHTIFRDADFDLACNPGASSSLCAGADNCLDIYNRDQSNFDGDPEGDACDADDDGDAVSDASDACPLDYDPCGSVSGDVDCDGGIDSVDALKVLRGAAGLPNAAGCFAGSGDVNCSGTITAVDALVLLRHVATLPVTLPVACPPIGT